MNWRKPTIFLLLEAAGREIPRYLGEIAKVSGAPRQEARVYQEQKLKRLLWHAYQHVPYYRRILPESKVIRNGKVDLQNFDGIPLLTKDIIRAEGDALCSDDFKKRKPYRNSSGGSTGEPVTLIQDRRYDDFRIATKIFFKKKFGRQDVGCRELRLWGSERDILEGQESIAVRLRNWLYNRKDLNTFRMSESDLRSFIATWNSFRPTWVESYVQSIHALARFAEAEQLDVAEPQGILTSAGTLYPDVRETIETVFSCPVFNRYGSREVGDIACGKDFLQIAFWQNHVEILENLSPVPEGEPGDVVVTTLNNFSMPLIRFHIGDVAIQGREFLLQSVRGREVSLFKTEDGTLVDGEYFTHLFFHKKWVKQFQVVQTDYDRITINLVADTPDNPEMLVIEKDIREVMGSSCRIEWILKEHIAPSPSGKYLYTISQLAGSSESRTRDRTGD